MTTMERIGFASFVVLLALFMSLPAFSLPSLELLVGLGAFVPLGLCLAAIANPEGLLSRWALGTAAQLRISEAQWLVRRRGWLWISLVFFAVGILKVFTALSELGVYELKPLWVENTQDISSLVCFVVTIAVVTKQWREPNYTLQQPVGGPLRADFVRRLVAGERWRYACLLRPTVVERRL